jgi:two-component SAPR family response regulator
MLEAYIGLSAGRVKVCQSALRKGLKIARQHRLVQTDWWHAERMSRLMEAALAAGIETDYVRHIIDVAGLRPGKLSVNSRSWPWPVVIEMLGGFELTVAGASASSNIKNQRKVMELLKVLVAYGSEHVAAAKVTDAVWPDADGDDGRNALKTTVHRLRKVLGHPEAVQYTEGQLSLNPEYCWSDVAAFQALAKTPPTSVEHQRNIEKALELYQGQFLDGDDHPWVIIARQKLRHIEHDILMALGSSYEQNQRWNKAISVYQHGIEKDPLDEQVCRHLMTCYQRSGREADAIAVYEVCRDQLQTLLARRPSAKTESLAKSMQYS